MSWLAGFDYQQSRIFFITAFWPSLESTQAPIKWVQRFFITVKGPEREADQLPLSSADIRNAWSYVSIPLYACLL